MSTLFSCASARMGDVESDSLFRQQKYEAAAERLKKGLEKEKEEGRDGLLYLMDLGLALHSAGKFEESNRYFSRADQLAEIKDYTSLAAESATLLTTDQLKQYRGEDFENVLINVYLAMNYACLGKVEDALIEARRVNRKLYLMNTLGKRKYKQNAFARYLSAILYESEESWDDAYLDYKFTAELMPDFPGLGEDLWRTAWRAGHREDLPSIEKRYRLTPEVKARAKKLAGRKRPGEVIVLYQNGISPRKGPDPGFHSIPRFYPRFNPVDHAVVKLESATGEVAEGRTHRIHDIEATAIQNLEEKWGGILAKKLAGVVAKEAVGNMVSSRSNQQGLGALVKLLLYASDQADTRSWNLLPRDLQVVRFVVKEGTYTLRALPQGGPALPEKTFQVRQGQKVFLTFRYMP